MKRFFLFLFLTLLLCACSTSVDPPTCEVYVSGNQLWVVIDLPAEGTEYRSFHDLVPPGMTGTPSSVEIESSGSAVEFPQTGNSYDIAYSVSYANGEIANYDITISGSVYDDEVFTCTP